MPIQFVCPGCQKTLKVTAKHAGKRGKCPDCKVVFRVPELSSESAPEAGQARSAEVKQPSVQPKRKAEQSSASAHLSAKRKRPGTLDTELDPFIQAASDRKKSPLVEDDFLGDLNAEDFDDYRGAPTSKQSKKPEEPVDEWDETYSLSESIEDNASTLPQLAPLRKKKKKKRKQTTEAPARIHAPPGVAKDFLILLFAFAMVPLVISIFSEEEPIMVRLTRTFGEETVSVIEQVESASDPEGELEKILDTVPGHKLAGAHLGYDTYMHWVYALIATGGFLGLLAILANREVSIGKILLYGLVTATVGIIILLAFQWIAFATQGVWVRGRGVVVLLFYLVKFIGFSYSAALDSNNGFMMSFFGFTMGVGLCEEIVKAVPVLFYLKDFEKPTWRGALMIGLASGVGFGISEGINYSSAHYNGYAGGMTYIVRFASCVSLHAVWAGTVAMLMFKNESNIEAGTEEPDLLMFLINYLLVVMILHGLYDTLLKKDMAVGALGIAAISVTWMAILFYRGRKTFEAELV